MMNIPREPVAADDIFSTMDGFRQKDLRWRSGRTFGYIYDAGAEVEKIAKRAYTAFMSENGLDPTSFPSLLRFENDLVAMGASHLGGDENTVGNFTSGGTESIILAVKAARDYCRAHRPGVSKPEMILPETAHAAFHKAAHYLDVKVVPVPVDTQTFKADVAAVAEAINDNTILLVASAPSYAHGVIDPIEELGQLALKHDLLLHVDACIGGFLLPYFRRLGEPVPAFDFKVPGVSSISMDLHKYAYAPKGASLILYRDKELRQFQIFSCSRWTGYSVVNPTVQSSKSGGPLAAAWAVLHAIADEGYEKIARALLDETKALVKGIEAIDGLYVMGKPEMSLLAFASDEVSVFNVVDEMKARGWYVQAQLAFGGSKENIHLTVAPSNVGTADELLADLAASVEAARSIAASSMATMLEGAIKNVDPSMVSGEMVGQLLSMAGVQGTELPERMAEINELLNTLSGEFSERLLAQFINEMFHPTPDLQPPA